MLTPQIAPVAEAAALTHRGLACLVAGMYGPDHCPGAPEVDWLYRSNPDAVMVFGIVRIGDVLVVVPRGSYTGRDWLLDVLVRDVDPAGRPSIIRVHSGFYTGTSEALDLVMLFHRPGDRIVIAAHSLGGARGEILAEQLVALGIVPHLLVTWGEPAPFKPSAMPGPGYPFVRYRNAVSDGWIDEVTRSTAIAGYRHRVASTDLAAPPPSRDRLDPFDLHHFSLYWPATPETAV